MTAMATLLHTVLTRHYGNDLVRHTQVSRNFGLLGGWLRVELWTHPSGDPTGLTASRIEYPGAVEAA